MTTPAEVFGRRLERYRQLYREGKLNAAQFAALLNGLPYGPLREVESGETFESLADITQRVVKGLK